MTKSEVEIVAKHLTPTMEAAIKLAARSEGAFSGQALKGRLKHGLIQRGVMTPAGAITPLGRAVAGAL